MSLAEMPTSSSVPKASPEDASAYARLSGDPDFLNLDDDQKVETLLLRGLGGEPDRPDPPDEAGRRPAVLRGHRR
jgi:hypothetical protein